MKINSKMLGCVIVLVIFGGILLLMALGWWQTSGGGRRRGGESAGAVSGCPLAILPRAELVPAQPALPGLSSGRLDAHASAGIKNAPNGAFLRSTFAGLLPPV